MLDGLELSDLRVGLVSGARERLERVEGWVCVGGGWRDRFERGGGAAITVLMRISWPAIGQSIARVVREFEWQAPDRLDGLRRIGFDELSYRVGQRYITVVVEHDSGRLVWAHEGRDKQTVQRFFDLLGEQRSARIEAVSSDLGAWIVRQVAVSCPAAMLLHRPFHVVSLATDALDEVRRELWNDARRAGDKH